MYSPNVDPTGSLYGKWLIKPNFWAITNRWLNFMFLLVGKDRAVLIDTGCGEGNIRNFVESITTKPVMVINTHGHFDHTGGNGCWPDAWMAEAAFADCKHAFDPEQKRLLAEKPYPDYQTHALCDGDIIDLGNHELEIFSIPAHHAGSIAILDYQNRILFTGDEIESGQVLLLKGRTDPDFYPTVTRHLDNILRLKSRRMDYDFICPAHNGCMLNPEQYLDEFITLDQQILSDTAVIMPDLAGFGFPPDPVTSGSIFGMFGKQIRVEHGLASIIYIDR
jgi:hydroxyacylglutathione hydrolase